MPLSNKVPVVGEEQEMSNPATTAGGEDVDVKVQAIATVNDDFPNKNVGHGISQEI